MRTVREQLELKFETQDFQKMNQAYVSFHH